MILLNNYFEMVIDASMYDILTSPTENGNDLFDEGICSIMGQIYYMLCIK